MKKSELNKNVLENFVLWYTHKNRDEAIEESPKDLFQLTSERFYKAVDDYIDGDHVDGEDNAEDHIVTFGAESSFEVEDPNKEFPETVVVVADFGEEGTQTISTLKGNSVNEVNDLLDFIKDPYGNKFGKLK